MQINSSIKAPVVARAASPKEAPKNQGSEQPAEPKDGFQNSAFSGKRDLAYAALTTLAQLPGPITSVVGNGYGIPQGVASLAGGLMAAAGARELMVNDTLHGRINGGVHFAVGMMTAVAPWSGNLSIPLFMASMTTLGLKAAFDQPGNIAKTTALEVGSMAKEVVTGWNRHES